ncbi:protein-glutamate methylesterase/protein-glutamine glutaminase [Cohnella laeviribosi]|uniref:protein-glutamate methylesterase/protein-glutamine glutaminase n=1 Tax=Cohnella laeviribosi TaxID=380174 RepID=UPI000362C9C4|nr:chemotaxis response regulator protein-glutamate methylesterase [Cohnella laeviribosi]
MSNFRVLVVDDSPFMRKVFSDFIAADPAFEVIGTASDGVEAVERTLQLEPDVITMDLEMPHMNGLQALRKIMALRPTPVIMISAVTDNGTRDTIKALQYGALDFIRKPDGAVKLDIRKVGEQLLEKLHIAVEMVKSGNFHLLYAIGDGEEEERGPAFGRTPSPADEAGKAPRAPAASASASAPSRLPSPAPKPLQPEPQQPAAPSPELTKPAPPSADAQPAEAGAQAPARSRGLPPPGPLAKLPPARRARPPAPADGLPDARGALGLPDKDGAAPATAKPAAAAKPQAAQEGAGREARPARPGRTDFTDIVVIGTSTGGPRALHEVLSALPESFPAPILIVQHMPPKFTRSLAQRLDTYSALSVREAQDGEPVVAGTAYIAPGGRHMALKRESAGRYRIALSDEPPYSGHKPSVDWLFESVLGMKELRRHAVLMTGMGSDGAKGMKALRDDGAVMTIAEAEQTCVVYGMPRSAVELGAATHVLRLQQIAPVLVQEVRERN